LCLVTDRRAARGDLVDCVAAAVSAGVDWVQIRERDLEGAALLDHAEIIAVAARRAAKDRGGRVAIIVNRRADIALSLDADGVQLGFDAMDAAAARRLLGTSALIGVSAHSADEIAKLPRDASYAQLAPIFPPLSKPHGGPCLGIDTIAAATRYGIPVLAQGGVTSDNAAALITAGAAGVAVTGAILSAPDPTAATRSLRAALTTKTAQPLG
jgi:thiamine-phosphate pyrophosphorylase